MSTTETTDRRANIKADLLERLHNPVQLRICLMAIILAAGYGGIYMPLSARIDETSKKLEHDKKLLVLADRMEHLQGQYHTFQDRIPDTDTKEWEHYMLDGIRGFPLLKLSKLSCEPPKQVGPYKAVVLKIDLEGSFAEIDKFLRWLESNHRLFRTDSLKLSPGHEKSTGMSMQLIVLGLTG